jgi:uncharacterized protein
VENIEQKPFRILALSGGGYRGLFTASVLKHLEASLGKPLHEQFDLIAGTSIGGISAVMIASGRSASEAVEFFIKNGRNVFPGNPGKIKRILKPAYSNAGLRAVLQSLFGTKTIGDLKSNILIPAINFTKGAPQVFKGPRHPVFDCDNGKSLLDVALSTSAAPTFFPIHKAPFGDMVDGGLVANNPSLYAFIEAKQFFKVSEANIRILHVGTMSNGITSNGKDRDLGGWAWLKPPHPPLIELILSSQERSTNYIMNILLGQSKYFSIDFPPAIEQVGSIGLAVVSDEANTVLQQSAEIAFQNALGVPGFRDTFQIKERVPADVNS